jgi:hypothetical protein
MTSPQTVSVSNNSVEYFRTQDSKLDNYASWLYNDDQSKIISIQSSCKSGNTDIKGIQRTIKNLQNEITKFQQFSGRFSNLNSAVGVFINEESGIGKDIKKVLDIATGDISGYVKNILGSVRGWVLNEVQSQAKKLLPFLFPGEMPSFIDNLSKGTNLISCAFAKIVRGLFKTIGNLLSDLIDRYINGPLCLIEDFISSLLDNILDPIINAINSALGFITGAISSLADSLFNALDFITGILNFFDCDDDKSCPSEDEINLSGTAGLSGDSVTPNFSSVFSKVDAGGKGSSGAPATQIAKIAFKPELNLT